MQLKISKIDPDIKHLIHRSDSYIGENGNNPNIGDIISSHDVEINSKGLWKLSIEDDGLLKKLRGQICHFQLNNEFIYILE
jgi:hypothetical protein